MPSLDWHFLLKRTGYYISECPLLPQKQVLHTWQAINIICWMIAGRLLGPAFLFICLGEGILMLPPFYYVGQIFSICSCMFKRKVHSSCCFFPFILMFLFKIEEIYWRYLLIWEKIYFWHTDRRKTEKFKFISSQIREVTTLFSWDLLSHFNANLLKLFYFGIMEIIESNFSPRKKCQLQTIRAWICEFLF